MSSAKLGAFVVAILLVVVAVAKAQSPDEAAPAGPTTVQQLVEQRVAETLRVVSLLVAKSSAPQEVKDAVQANAQAQLTACAEQVAVDGQLGPFYACSGQVVSSAALGLSSPASSGASSVN